MRTNMKLIFLLLIVSAVFLSTSCNLLWEQDDDIVGVWGGLVNDDEYDTIYFEFLEDGTAKLAGDVMYTEGESASYTWSTDGNHLEISAAIGFYKGYYVYEYDSITESLSLYMMANSLMNEMYEYFSPGDVINLTKSDLTFETLISNDNTDPLDTVNYLY